MDRETRSEIWADVTDSDAVTSILEEYGYSTDVDATSAKHSTKKHSLAQRDTDLVFVRRLAKRYGYLFWVTCDSDGNETAHFKRPPLDGSLAGELAINLESPSIETLDIEWDAERPFRVESLQLDLNTKKNLDGAVEETPQTLLGSRGLADVAGNSHSMRLNAPVDDAGDLRERCEGALIEADWFIRARCRTSLKMFGDLVRAHTVVRIRGAGSRHSGKYFVAAVNHRIDAAAHRMDIELVRNAWE
jgi:phage protein D